MKNLFMLKDETVVNVNDDETKIVTWNGSATFNIYAFTQGQITPLDCFVNYHCDTMAQAELLAVDFLSIKD